jgi:hypothetical protein
MRVSWVSAISRWASNSVGEDDRIVVRTVARRLRILKNEGTEEGEAGRVG